VIRRYVGHRYYIITMELTTAELIDSMTDAEIDDVHIETIRSFLEECDLVKFAKHIPPEERMSELVPKARTIVDATKETLLILGEKEEEENRNKEVEPPEAEPVSADTAPSLKDEP